MMNDNNKTKAQLIEEMVALRERNAELEAREAEHQRTEQVQSAFYRIADAASAVEDMQEFYATLHQILNELVVADNFYIALYDETRQLVNIPYEVDSANPGRYNPQAWEPLSKSVTSYVLRTGQFVDIERVNELIKQGEVEFRGNKSVDGMGIPLIVDGRTVGMLAVQGYTEDTHYTEQDKKLFNFVAQHIATALERARLLDDTRQRNAELAIINSVGEGLAKQLEYQAIIDLVGDKISEIFQAHSVGIGLLDPETNLINVPYYLYLGQRQQMEPFEFGEGLGSHVIRSGRPLLINENTQERFAELGAVYWTEDDSTKSWLGVPILAGDKAIGSIGMQDIKENAFTEADVRLLSTLVANMGVALENARLFDETNRLLAESEAQVAELSTLNIISQGLVAQLDLQGVVDLVGDKIREIISADGLNIALYDAKNNMLDFPYFYDGDTRIYDKPRPLEGGFIATIIETGQPVVISTRQELFDRKGVIPEHRRDSLPEEFSWLGVPILIGQEITGTIYILKFQDHAFTKADVQLLSTIAANMGVAIENARLFNELQTRNQEIAESLQQQTATGEILRAMAGSLSDVQPVFDAIAKNAASLAGTGFSTVYRYDGQMLDVVAIHNLPPENVAAVRKAYPRPLTRDVGLSAMSIIDRMAYNVADVEQDPRVPPHMVKITLDAGMRSLLFVPMMRQDVAIGVIGILRREAGAFTEKQIALLNTFADQAIIAIENVELFNETKRLLAESEAQVTELSTLNIISQGLVAQLDLQSVIDLVGDKIREIITVENLGVALYGAESNMVLYPYIFAKGQRIVNVDSHPFGEGLISVVIQSGQPLLLHTLQEMVDRGAIFPPQQNNISQGSWLGIPVKIGNDVTGALFIFKEEDHVFNESDERLLTTIVANMGVAIENARLFEKIQQTNQELSQTLKELKSTQGQLVEAEKMAALGGLVAGVAHEINTPVGVGVTAASTLQDKTTGFSEIYKSGQMKRSDLEKYLNIAEQSSAMILRNLERAAGLIQSFKQVAVDQSSEERRQFLVKAYLEEILLSLRPKLKKTQLTIEINGDDSLTLDSYPGAFSQIVTNLVMNSLLHAYEPDDQGQLTFDLRQRDGRLIFEYNDDGKGIPAENLSKIFEPFFTTKRTQGGSGLGLHIIYNLVTQRLGGAIHCQSEVGTGTKFIIEVPVS